MSLGCEGLIGKNATFIHKAVDMMEEAGANAIDLYSPNPQTRSLLVKALSGRINKIVFEAHICAIWQNDQYNRARKLEDVKTGFED